MTGTQGHEFSAPEGVNEGTTAVKPELQTLAEIPLVPGEECLDTGGWCQLCLQPLRSLFSDLSSRAKGGLASALLKLPSLPRPTLTLQAVEWALVL